MALTTDQARAIADAFLSAGNVVDDYLDKNFQKISRAEYEFLNESFKTLVRASSFATTVAVDLAISDLQDPAAELRSVIEQAKKEIAKMQMVGRIIRLAAGLTGLAASIMAKDPGAIAKAIEDLKKLIRS